MLEIRAPTNIVSDNPNTISPAANSGDTSGMSIEILHEFLHNEPVSKRWKLEKGSVSIARRP
jgi:hypothetical protein